MDERERLEELFAGEALIEHLGEVPALVRASGGARFEVLEWVRARALARPAEREALRDWLAAISYPGQALRCALWALVCELTPDADDSTASFLTRLAAEPRWRHELRENRADPTIRSAVKRWMVRGPLRQRLAIGACLDGDECVLDAMQLSELIQNYTSDEVFFGDAAAVSEGLFDVLGQKLRAPDHQAFVSLMATYSVRDPKSEAHQDAALLLWRASACLRVEDLFDQGHEPLFEALRELWTHCRGVRRDRALGAMSTLTRWLSHRALAELLASKGVDTLVRAPEAPLFGSNFVRAITGRIFSELEAPDRVAWLRDLRGRLANTSPLLPILEAVVHSRFGRGAAVDYYNVACELLALKCRGAALQALKNAVSRDRSLSADARTDPDFENLWKDDEFLALTA